MNEITRIHLARTPYEIDIAAKVELEKYLREVRKSLSDEELMNDIEIRMTEILDERGVNRDGVITLSDINAIRERLGEPRDFKDDNQNTDENWQDNVFTHGKDGPSKRFYRDEDSGMFGGVIAGLAAYIGWEDVTLLRILVVILTIIPSFGTLIIVYIIVWAIAPAAKTAGEKLEMRGEPITLDNIKNAEFTRKVKKFAKDGNVQVGKMQVGIIKEKASIIKDEVKTKKDKAKESAKASAAEIKSKAVEIREEIQPRVSPVAATIGVFFHIFGFIILAAAITTSVFFTVLLIQNNFAKEVWLWLAAGSFAVSLFTLVGFFIATGQGLMDVKQRRHLTQEIAGTLGAFVLFSIMSCTMLGIWFWSIPANYELPNPVSEQIEQIIKRERQITDDEVCEVRLRMPSGNILIKDCDD